MKVSNFREAKNTNNCYSITFTLINTGSQIKTSWNALKAFKRQSHQTPANSEDRLRSQSQRCSEPVQTKISTRRLQEGFKLNWSQSTQANTKKLSVSEVLRMLQQTAKQAIGLRVRREHCVPENKFPDSIRAV